MKDKNLTKELSVVTQDWLKANDVRVNSSYLRNAIKTHPDYPALTSLTDFLESGGMDYDAVRADISFVNEFRYPLLAHMKKPGSEYLHLIKNLGEWKTDKAIAENWSGVALYSSKPKWQHDDNEAAQKEELKKKYIATIFITACFCLFAASVYFYLDFATNIFGLLSLTGVTLSIAALSTELGYQSTLVKQVCGTIGNGGCEKVLGSKYSKGFAGITPADASLLYFAAQFILYLVGCFINGHFSGILNLAFTGILVAGWSVYTQAYKVKEWCAICLSIVAVLLGQIIIAIIKYQNTKLLILEPYMFLVLTLGMLALIYLPIKHLLMVNLKSKKELITFRKWKTDASLFITQWKTQPTCNNEMWENDLIIGDADSLIRFTVACNPFCLPCAKEHFELDKILERYPNQVCVQLRILCIPENMNDRSTMALQAILKRTNNYSDKNRLKNLMTDWFYFMNLQSFVNKWKLENPNSVQEELQMHSKWFKENNIKQTPTIFLNGKMLPNRYQLKDIHLMLPQLIDLIN